MQTPSGWRTHIARTRSRREPAATFAGARACLVGLVLMTGVQTALAQTASPALEPLRDRNLTHRVEFQGAQVSDAGRGPAVARGPLEPLRDRNLTHRVEFQGAQVSDGGRGPAVARGALELRKDDRIVFVGNTLAERMQHFNHFETLLLTRFPDLQLSVRNLGWSGDTITLQPRPLNFGDAQKHLSAQKADVILAFFGLNESFYGKAGLDAFARDLDAYLGTHLAAAYNGRTPPRLVLVSPIAHEQLPHLRHVDASARNEELARYTEIMKRTAAARQVVFVDLFTPTSTLMAGRGEPLTINGIHLNEHGDRIVANLLMDGLGLAGPDARVANATQLRQLETLRDEIRDKNQQFFFRWRPLNAEYVLGRRVEPFGSVSFPPEMKKLDEMVAERERAIWKRARSLRGLKYPADAPVGGTVSNAGRN